MQAMHICRARGAIGIALPLRVWRQPLMMGAQRRFLAAPATAATTVTVEREQESSQLFDDGRPSVDAPAPRGALSPAESDATRFMLDPAVKKWLAFGPSRPELPTILSMVAAEGSKDAFAATYWSAHMARLFFFAGQSASALVAHTLSELFISAGAGKLPNSAASKEGAAGAALQGELPAARMARNANVEAGMRLWECYGTWQQDLEWIRDGVYKYPWDMEDIRASQYRPDNVITRSARFMSEAAATLQRNMRKAPDPNWLRSPLFPPYFRTSFHYQSDGWLSAWSADIYEHSTETLFWGRQDAMQRTALVPISQYLAGRPLSDLRLLEVAAGTGRFHTFIKDCWPEMHTICSDLSPFYLARARENMMEWKRLRQPDRLFGGVDGTGVEFLQAAAEDLQGVPDASLDVVVSVYLFHEVPEAVRRRAFAEWYRVLKPGGLMVLTDSCQLGDRPERDHAIHIFGNFNEPHYASYIKSDLGASGEQAGFLPGGKWVSSFTKTLSFIKPLDAPTTDN